jgi:hypothetical protein
MIIPSRNGIECIEDHTLEVTSRESVMTYYDNISNRTTYQYSMNKTEKKYVQWVYTYQESWELSLILIVTIHFTERNVRILFV